MILKIGLNIGQLMSLDLIFTFLHVFDSAMKDVIIWIVLQIIIVFLNNSSLKITYHKLGPKYSSAYKRPALRITAYTHCTLNYSIDLMSTFYDNHITHCRNTTINHKSLHSKSALLLLLLSMHSNMQHIAPKRRLSINRN